MNVLNNSAVSNVQTSHHESLMRAKKLPRRHQRCYEQMSAHMSQFTRVQMIVRWMVYHTMNRACNMCDKDKCEIGNVWDLRIQRPWKRWTCWPLRRCATKFIYTSMTWAKTYLHIFLSNDWQRVIYHMSCRPSTWVSIADVFIACSNTLMRARP